MPSPQTKIITVLEAILDGLPISPKEGYAFVERASLKNLTLAEFEQILDKLVSMSYISYEAPAIEVMPRVKVYKDWIREYSVKVLDKEGLESYRIDLMTDLENPDIPVELCRFRFDKTTGILHRDGYDQAIPFGKSKFQRAMLEAVFSKNFGEEVSIDDIANVKRENFCNTAYKINAKLKTIFKLKENFFDVNEPDRKIIRCIR